MAKDSSDNIYENIGNIRITYKKKAIEKLIKIGRTVMF